MHTAGQCSPVHLVMLWQHSPLYKSRFTHAQGTTTALCPHKQALRTEPAAQLSLCKQQFGTHIMEEGRDLQATAKLVELSSTTESISLKPA